MLSRRASALPSSTPNESALTSAVTAPISQARDHDHESTDRASGERLIVPGPTLRVSALACLGVRTLSDAVGWTMEALVRPGFLAPWGGDIPFFFEDGAGLVWSEPHRRALDDDAMPEIVARLWDLKEPVLDAADFGLVLGVARARVLGALRGLLTTPPNDGFVHAALYTGRVVRVAPADESDSATKGWTVRLTPTLSLSEQVLALFAADMLENRADYYDALTVCDLCDLVAFDAADLDVPRTRCVDHQDEP